jgi:hypothetical protein
MELGAFAMMHDKQITSPQGKELLSKVSVVALSKEVMEGKQK